MSRTAVVLFNLGGPDRPQSVRPFLFNLFNDRAIIALPQPFRWLLARLISGRRAAIARAIYDQMGGGSPLLANTEAQARALEVALGPDHRCFLAMRYWHPLSEATARAVAQWGPERVVLLPLYPQYSTTTTAS
jgi:ferrochelatase